MRRLRRKSEFLSLVAVFSVGAVLSAFAVSSSLAEPVRSSASVVGKRLDFDEASSVVVSQDEKSIVRRDENGVFQATLSFSPERVEVDGEWVAISTDLTHLADGGFAARTHPFFPEFSSESSEKDMLSVSKGDYTLSMGVLGAAEVRAEAVGADVSLGAAEALRYPGILQGADLLIGIDGSSVKQALVFAEPPAEALEATWLVNAPGLAPHLNELGDLDFVDSEGITAFTVVKASVWDSSGDHGVFDSNAINVDYEIESLGDGVYSLSVEPPLEWLRDPATVYPVYVDPNIDDSSIYAYKQDGFSNTGVAQVGNSQQSSTCCDWRTVLKYELSGYPNVRVTDADIYARRNAGSSGNNNAQAGNVYHATSFNYNGVGQHLSGLTIGYDGWATDLGLSDWVSRQVNTNTWTGFLMLTGEESNSIYSYKALDSVMILEFVPLPTVDSVTVNGKSPSSVTNVHAADIVIAATGSNHFSGTSQQFQFVFSSQDGANSYTTAYTTSWLSSDAFRLPESVLSAGKNYKMEVFTRDTGPVTPVAKWASSWVFHVQAPPTVVAGSVKVDSTVLTGTAPAGTPLAAYVSPSSLPTLSATVYARDGGTVWAVFTVKRDGIVIVDSLQGSKSPNLGNRRQFVSTVQLPYALDPAGSYTVEVQGFDGVLASTPELPKQPFKVASSGSYEEIPGLHDQETVVAP